MTRDEVIGLLEAMAESLREKPNQFTFTVSISAIGAQASNTGGTGFSTSAVGGGPGSTTIGLQSSANISDADVQIAEGDASAEVLAQVEDAATALDSIVDALRTSKPDRKSLAGHVGDFAQKVIPAVLVETVKYALGSIGVGPKEGAPR